MPRTFEVAPGRTVTLPQGLLAGPGATHLRLPPGAKVTLDDARCVAFGRFVSRRKRDGDWTELPTAIGVHGDTTGAQHLTPLGSGKKLRPLHMGAPPAPPAAPTPAPSSAAATPTPAPANSAAAAAEPTKKAVTP